MEPGADACLPGMTETHKHTQNTYTHIGRDIHRHTHRAGACHQGPLAQILPQFQILCTCPKKEAEVTPFLQEHLMPGPGGASCLSQDRSTGSKWLLSGQLVV